MQRAGARAVTDRARERLDALDRIRSLAEYIGRTKLQLEYDERKLANLINEVQHDAEF